LSEVFVVVKYMFKALTKKKGRDIRILQSDGLETMTSESQICKQKHWSPVSWKRISCFTRRDFL